MIVYQSLDMALWGVFDAGVPNQERIILQVAAKQPVNLAKFIVMPGHVTDDGTGAVPLRDQALWMGDLFLDPGTVIFIYTGKGTPGFSRTAAGTPSYITFWGRDATMFQDNRIVPMVVEIAFATVQRSPDWLLQTEPQQAQLPLKSG
jgi:hypothetical protein